MKVFTAALVALLGVGVARAAISVSVRAKGTDMEALVSGSNVDVISDKERQTFNINDSTIKDAINKYLGGYPDDAYVRSPTPWGDLYDSYGWNQVRRTLRPLQARVISSHSEPEMVAYREFINNSTVKASYNAGLSQEVANTVGSSWSKEGELSVSQDISYGFEFSGVEIGGTTSFGYSSRWGEETSRSEAVTLSSSAGVTVELEPGQKVRAELSAMRGHLEVEVDYESFLNGDVACNYNSPYRGHHFWKLDVNAVMQAGSIPRRITSKEILKIGFYSDATIVVKDMKEEKKLLYLPVNFFAHSVNSVI